MGSTILTGQVLRLDGDGYLQKIFRVPNTLRAIPYYAWCHRGAGSMNVWFYSDRYVFAPTLRPDSSLFLDNIEVECKRYDGQEIRYTLDNSDPTAYSSLYGGSFMISGNTRIKARAFNRQGGSSETVAGQFRQTTTMPAFELTGLSPGVNYSYYRGKIKGVEAIHTLSSRGTGVLPYFNITDTRDTSDFYALSFYGLIRIPADGLYDFELISDDGSRLMVDGTTVVMNDGVHGSKGVHGQVALQKGLHKLILNYFEYNGDEQLEIWVKGPGVERQLLPADWLFK